MRTFLIVVGIRLAEFVAIWFGYEIGMAGPRHLLQAFIFFMFVASVITFFSAAAEFKRPIKFHPSASRTFLSVLEIGIVIALIWYGASMLAVLSLASWCLMYMARAAAIRAQGERL